MINGTTVIKAKDTVTAMEKVVSELGEDCVIISTKKVNGQIVITASNTQKAKKSVKKRYDKKKFAKIYKLKSGKLDIKKSDQQVFLNQNSIKKEELGTLYKDLLRSEMSFLLDKIDKKLENIYVTDNLNKNSYLFSTTLKLKQLGFSSYAINKFQSENNNLNFEENRLDFFRKLSANIASPYPE